MFTFAFDYCNINTLFGLFNIILKLHKYCLNLYEFDYCCYFCCYILHASLNSLIIFVIIKLNRVRSVL